MELHHGYSHIVICYCRYCLKIFGFYFILYFWQPDSIRVMGDKSTARDTMKNAGVPTVPGSDGLLQVPHLIILGTIRPKRWHLDCFKIYYLSSGHLC